MQTITDVLSGRRGLGWAMLAWGLPLTLALFLLSSWIVVPVALVGVALSVSAPRGRAALLGLALFSALAVALGWYAWGVGFDYADTYRQPPAWTELWWLPLAAGLLGAGAWLAVLIRTIAARGSKQRP